MKKKLITILLCTCMAASLFSGCGKKDKNEVPEEAAVEESAEEQAEEQAEEIPEEVPVIYNLADFTPEEALAKVLEIYNTDPVKNYTALRYLNWDTPITEESVKIDLDSKLVSVTATNDADGSTNSYILSSEADGEFVYAEDTSSSDGYIKIGGFDTMSYAAYTEPMFVPTVSADGYEILDYSLKLSEISEEDGQQVADIYVTYTKTLTDPATGAAVELEVFDYFKFTADTLQLLERVYESEDIADPASSYNHVDEIYFVTGKDAIAPSLSGHAYELPVITYEEYIQ